jgi:ketosteroid isomerase-like protein
MRATLAVLAAAALAAALPAHAGWDDVRGSGTKVTQARRVGAFEKVRLIGSLDLRVGVGGPVAVAVTIDDNLQPLVETAVEGDTLVVRARERLSYRGEGRVDVTVPSLRALAIEGSGDASIEGGAGDLALSVSGSGDLAWRGEAARLEASVAGSGDMKLAGRADTTRIAVAGSGDVDAWGLTSRSADVQISGSGDVRLTLAGGELSASVAGSGDVTWQGEATVTRSVVAGSGQISRR